MKTHSQYRTTWLGFVCLALMLLGWGGSAWSQVVIESVSGQLQDGSEMVRIELSEPLAQMPQGFETQVPATIALDFAGVTSAVGRASINVQQGNLRSIRVLQAGERSRVIMHLKQATRYKMRLVGKTLLVTLSPVNLGALPPTVRESAGGAQDLPSLRALDFRREGAGTGRVVVSLPNSQMGVDVRQQGQSLVVEFAKASLTEGLRRKLDVSDFATPVQAVTTFQVGDRVRMIIEPQGAWEHSAYQRDDLFVVEVRPQRNDPSKLTQGAGYNGQKLSLNFQNIEVRSLLQVIADFTNFNVVTSDSVTGAVTLRLQEVPWDQALDIILQAKGLGVRKTGNVLWVAPKDEILAKEKLEREAHVALEGLETLRTESFQLNYAKSVDVARQLMGGVAPGAPMPAIGGVMTPASARLLSPRGSAMAEPRTNQLFVTDVASRLEQVRTLIAKLDVAVRQVLIEARIVEASDTFGRSLGVKLGGGPGTTIDTANTRGGAQFGASYNATSAGANAGTFVNLPAVGQGGYNAATFAVSIFGESAARFLNLEISALEADGKGKVISSPRVVTADKIKAVIEQGTELPYQVATASGATSIAFRKANLKLEVTPQITPEGNVILELDISKDTVGRSTAAGFAIDTKHIQTQVLVDNGGTVVIGGIFEQVERDDVAKVPLFGDLPVVGNLFKSRGKISNKQEMLVFITPKMLSDKVVVR